MLHLVFAVAFLAGVPMAEQQTDSEPPEDTFYTVSYVEIEAASRDTAIAAFHTYRDRGNAVDGYLRFELFEEPNQSGRFSIIETWRNQAAFDESGTAMRQGLIEALDPIRVSEYDQRPYRPLAVGSGRETPDEGGVHVVAHVDVSPNPEVPLLLEQHAATSRRDEGNIRFDVLQHTMRANHFTVIEVWQGAEAYRAHVESDHSREYRDALAPFLGSPLDQRLYQAVD